MTPAEFAERLLNKYGSLLAIKRELGISPDPIYRWQQNGTLDKKSSKSITGKLDAAFDALNLSDDDIASLKAYKPTTIGVQGKPRLNPSKVIARKFTPKGTTHTLGHNPVKLVRRDNVWFGFEWICGDWRRSNYVEANMRHAVSVLTGRRFAV